MRTSSLLAVISLFLIGSFSLPQPENLAATRTIENREAKIPAGIPGGKGAEWHKHHKDGGQPPASNGTSIKEREAHHKYIHPSNHADDPLADPKDRKPFFDHKHSSAPSNSTEIKEREAQAGPPDGMTWAEFKKHSKHMKHEGGDGPAANNTTVKMVKFRE